MILIQQDKHFGTKVILNTYKYKTKVGGTKTLREAQKNQLAEIIKEWRRQGKMSLMLPLC